MKKSFQKRSQSGQTMVFLVMVVVILAFVALWNFDLHKMIYIKAISGNASDGAAIAAARWQGITLNLLGDLNVAEAVAIDYALAHPVGTPPQPDFTEAIAIAELGKRAHYAGLMVGYSVAQQAAKNNRAYVNPVFTQRVHNHALTVRAMAQDNPLLLEYADMLDTVAGQGIAAIAGDNAYHILLDSNFYTAVDVSNWCWLRRWLNTTWPNWPPLSFKEPLSLDINTRKTLASLDGWMGDPSTPEKALQSLSSFAGHNLTHGLITETNIPATWFCYNNNWSSWSQYLQESGDGSPYPFIASIKSEYDVLGAAVDMRVSTETPAAYFNKSSNHVTSVAAAKPFGYLEGPVLASQYGLVLPAFHDARLIPVDSAGVAPPPDDYGDSKALDAHATQHVPIYLKYGPDGIQDLVGQCHYCWILYNWDTIRLVGKAWLTTNTCPHSYGGGGGGGGGGSAHGH